MVNWQAVLITALLTTWSRHRTPSRIVRDPLEEAAAEVNT